MACIAKTRGKAGNVRSLIWAGALLGGTIFFVPVKAQDSTASDPTPTYSGYSGTTWTCDVEGATSVMVFKSDGEWTEDWKDMHVQGRWKANTSNSEVVVTRTDNFVLHYKLHSDKNLVRDWRTITYKLSAWGAGEKQSLTFPSWYIIGLAVAVVAFGLSVGYGTGGRVDAVRAVPKAVT